MDPALPAGVYTITIAVDESRNTPTVAAKEPVTILDTMPPGAPSHLQAQARGDGSVLLTWDGAVAEPDVAGYRVAVDGGVALNSYGTAAHYELFGLQPGVAHQVAVSAYDLSGNVGPAATVGVQMPLLTLAANWPQRGQNSRPVGEIWATFNRPITLIGFTLLNARGQSVPGTVTPITATTGLTQTVTLGGRFLPARGVLPAESFTAVIDARDTQTGVAQRAEWPFTAQPPIRGFMPIICRKSW